jgi:hypothetical protein
MSTAYKKYNSCRLKKCDSIVTKYEMLRNKTCKKFKLRSKKLINCGNSFEKENPEKNIYKQYTTCSETLKCKKEFVAYNNERKKMLKRFNAMRTTQK